MILVGMFWGCTNPLLRKGSSDIGTSNNESLHLHKTSQNRKERSDESNLGSTDADDNKVDRNKHTASIIKIVQSNILRQLYKFRDIRVWLPYAINQLGSLFFYITLSNTNLSIAVPSCNALALVFSILTSYVIGERIHQPVRSIVGSTLVMVGVALCVTQ